MRSAHRFHDVVERRTRRNSLRVAHDALGVEHIALGHGAAVHAELTHQHRLVFAVDFHVGSGGRVRRATRGGLRPFVIHHRPKTARVPRPFEGLGVDVIHCAVAAAHRFHFGPGQLSVRQGQPNESRQHLVCAFHARNIN
jgi:hypothetical protein